MSFQKMYQLVQFSQHMKYKNEQMRLRHRKREQTLNDEKKPQNKNHTIKETEGS